MCVLVGLYIHLWIQLLLYIHLILYSSLYWCYNLTLVIFAFIIAYIPWFMFRKLYYVFIFRLQLSVSDVESWRKRTRSGRWSLKMKKVKGESPNIYQVNYLEHKLKNLIRNIFIIYESLWMFPVSFWCSSPLNGVATFQQQLDARFCLRHEDILVILLRLRSEASQLGKAKPREAWGGQQHAVTTLPQTF